MNSTITQNILDLVFKFFTPYLAPIIFLFVILIFADKLVLFIRKNINQ